MAAMWRSLLPARELLLLLVVGCQRTMSAAVMFRPGQRHSFVDLSLLAPEGADPVSQQQQLDLRQQAPDHDFGFREPLITANAPWERGCLVSSYSSVFQGQPDGRVSLFYQLYCSIDPSQPLNFSDGTVAMVALAESMDGLNWVKPVVNQISFRNSTQNNVVMFPEGSVSSMSELEGASVFRDPRSGKLVSVAALMTAIVVSNVGSAGGSFDDSSSGSASVSVSVSAFAPMCENARPCAFDCRPSPASWRAGAQGLELELDREVAPQLGIGGE